MAPEPKSTPQTDEVGAAEFAEALRGRRKTLGWTLERMAREVEHRTDETVDAETLAEIERDGGAGRARALLGAVAESYEVSVDSLPATRQPVEIMGGAIVIGDLKVDFYSEHMDDVLVAFLEAIRTVRGDTKHEVAGFRRIDVEVLADYLHCQGVTVVERLADLVGASSSHCASMTELYRAGADMIPSGAVRAPIVDTGSSRFSQLLTSRR
ncbi:MAG: hypothetical protein ACR2PK_19240 [Acidimicrobiales bacterium]